MIYTYRCKKCERKFERDILVGSKKIRAKCPYCKSLKTKKIIVHAPKVHFLGSGWGKDKK